MTDGTWPEGLRFHEDHAWVRVDGDMATVGITDHAQAKLGEVIFHDPPDVGARVRAGEACGELESVKAVTDVVAPVDGEVVDVNGRAVDAPELVNEDPWGTWLARIRMERPEQASDLLDAAGYRRLVER